MRFTRWMVACVVGFFLLSGNLARAQGHGNGHGKGHEKHGEDADHDYYKNHDRETMRGWYDDHENNLPPGLAKKDQLPPGLEKQLVRRGTLPERRLPPPPPECAHVLVGGHIVLLNRRTNVVVDLVHFEIR